MASSCFNASEKLLASNSLNALSYITSSSAFEGATLLAAKELSTKTGIATIFLMFMPLPIKAFRAIDDKPKIGRPLGTPTRKQELHRKQRAIRWSVNPRRKPILNRRDR